jgi:hypothetical protein
VGLPRYQYGPPPAGFMTPFKIKTRNETKAIMLPNLFCFSTSVALYVFTKTVVLDSSYGYGGGYGGGGGGYGGGYYG